MSNIERRNFTAEFTAEADFKLIGYVNRYGSESQIMRDKRGVKFVETIERGAFTDSIADSSNDIYADYNHDESQVLGRQSEGTLKLTEDDYGLRAEIQLNPNDPQHVSVYQKVKRRDVKGMSFGFYPYEQREVKLTSKLVKRNVTRAKLFAVSPVVNPAYETSEVQARNLETMEEATATDVAEAFNALSDEGKAELLKSITPAKENVKTEEAKTETAEPKSEPKAEAKPIEEKENAKSVEDKTADYAKELLDRLGELLKADTPVD